MLTYGKPTERSASFAAERLMLNWYHVLLNKRGERLALRGKSAR